MAGRSISVADIITLRPKQAAGDAVASFRPRLIVAVPRSLRFCLYADISLAILEASRHVRIANGESARAGSAGGDSKVDSHADAKAETKAESSNRPRQATRFLILDLVRVLT